MSRLPYSGFLLLTGGLLFGATLLCESAGFAQDKETFTTPKIVTVDGVRLNAAFYASPKKCLATVIMLHPIGVGENSNKPGWKTLAETLQKNNYSVLVFDFRGHGDSTVIDQPDDFWKIPQNRTYVKPTGKEKPDREKIDVKDFIKSINVYAPILINDIAAVKAFLDRRNDTQECNTANTIVVGAESGATLGAIWINSQWNCHKYTPPPNMFVKPVIDKRAEGNDIVGAVWLNIQPTLGTRPIVLHSVLKKACKDQAMPAAFFYGEKDGKARDFNKGLVDKIIVKGSKKHSVIGPVEMPDTNLAGVKLLQKGLKTDEVILEYIATRILLDRGNDWDMRNYGETAFGFRDPRTSLFLPAKRKDQKLFQFDTYEKYLNP